MGVRGLITSTGNSHIRLARSLHKARARRREERYILDGHRLVAQALQTAPGELVFSLHTEAYASTVEGTALLDALTRQDLAMWITSPEVMAYVSDTETPQGILAIANMPAPDLNLARAASLVVVLDELRDPGNLGTILRTCQATGVGAALLTVGCVDPYAPKVVRAGMGAHLRVALVPSLNWPQIEDLLAGKQRLLADAQGTATPWEVDWRSPTALIVGGEAHGPGPQARALATQVVRLPMAGEAESLNAAIATAVFLYEAYRQRHIG